MDKYPSKVSMMIAMSAWWLGTCIISVAYSANLVAIMSVEVESYPVNSLEELATQTHTKVGGSSGTALHSTLQVNLTISVINFVKYDCDLPFMPRKMIFKHVIMCGTFNKGCNMAAQVRH